MKNRIKQFTYIIALSLGLTGCSDFLEVSDKGSMSPAVFPSSIEHLELMLNSSYAGSHTKGLYTFYWFPMGLYLYDNTSNTDGDYDSRSDQMLNRTRTDCEYNTQTYADVFRFVELSNAVLDGIEKYRSDYPETSSSANEATRINYIKGQALFNRALAYWHGQVFFEIESKAGGLGLPLYETVPKSIDEMMKQRSTTEESWNFIIETFQEAIPLLQGYTDPTRATEWAAKAMLAKSYMQARRPSEAKPILEDIIQNSGKELVSFDIYSNMFYGLSEYEFNQESLYEIDMTINDKQPGPWAGFTTGSGMPMVFAPWPVNLDILRRPTDQPAVSTGPDDINTNSTGGWGNNYIHDGNIRRFGFTEPPAGNKVLNPDFDRDTYDADRNARSAYNYPYMLRADYYQRSIEIRENGEADPRLYISAAQPYVDTLLDSEDRVTYYDRSPSLYDRANDLLMWNHKKFTNRLGYENDKNFSSDANYPVARLADIYLLYAEVIKDSDPTTALEYINKVKRRAYNYPVNSPSPVDYSSLTDRTMAMAGDHLANDPLKYERWAELFAEGQWWFDVRRWEIGKEEMDYYKENRAGTLIWRGIDCYVQPIPKTEIERYNGNIVQSGNY